MTVVSAPDLSGRVALVTGSSRGIGSATARALAAHGARVAVNGRDPAAATDLAATITTGGGTALAVPGDATDAATLHRIRERTEAELGPIDILAPFVGGHGRPVPTHELGADLWRTAVDANLTSVFLAVAEVLPGMIERRSGVVITLASTAGRHPSQANAAYAAANAGVVMLTRHLAAEVGRHGIRVNCLAPSAVLTDGVREQLTGDRLTELTAEFPLGRVGRPEDVAGAVLYLASDAASWITGVTLDLTGGRVIA